MKGIAVAFEGRLGRDAEIKTAKASGKPFLAMSIIEGDEDDGAHWLNVVAWSESLTEIAAHLTKGTQVYVEGKIKLRSWETPEGERRSGLSVSASLVQPLALIGRSRPKATRKTSAAQARGANQTSAAVHQPLPFDDAIPF